ncbi:hypothetical protein H8E77_37560 [bacterium]|nr:hypothetical protein [bacterium]
MQFLYKTVKEVLDSGRIGSPVFVRCILFPPLLFPSLTRNCDENIEAQIASDREHLTDVLAKSLATVSSWLDASPQRVYAQGGKDAGQITATVHYVSGQTALVSVGTVKANDTPCADLMLLGNKGAIYHDSLILPSFAIAADSLVAKQLPNTKLFMDAVERSLQTGKSAIIEGGKTDE